MPAIESISENHSRSAANFVGEVVETDYQNHENPFSDEESNMREIESAMQNHKMTAVIWNPFRDQNNLCSGGTYGDSGIATLRQFAPEVIFVRKVPRITPKRPDEQAILMGEAAIGSDVALVQRSASETAATLLKIHGPVGATLLPSLADNDFKKIPGKLLVYEIVMQGWNAQGLLEDLPEYFGTRSPLLPEKYDAVPGTGRDNSYAMTAAQILDQAGKTGIMIKTVHSKVMVMDPSLTDYLSEPCKLDAKEIALGKQLISELQAAALKMHGYAVGAEGVLPKSKEHLESVKRGPTFGKQKLDELDRYLMLNFPSYPMDTEIEKSERNQRRGMESILRNIPGGNNSNNEEMELLRAQNKLLMEAKAETDKRLADLEKAQGKSK